MHKQPQAQPLFVASDVTEVNLSRHCSIYVLQAGPKVRFVLEEDNIGGSLSALEYKGFFSSTYMSLRLFRELIYESEANQCSHSRSKDEFGKENGSD